MGWLWNCVCTPRLYCTGSVAHLGNVTADVSRFTSRYSFSLTFSFTWGCVKAWKWAFTVSCLSKGVIIKWEIRILINSQDHFLKPQLYLLCSEVVSYGVPHHAGKAFDIICCTSTGMFWLSQSIWTMTPLPALSVTDNSSKSFSREPVCWPPCVGGEVSPRADDHTPYDIMYAPVM